MDTLQDRSVLAVALQTLRIAVPAALCAVLIVRFVSRAFLHGMESLQSQGWTSLDEDEPIVVGVKKPEDGIVDIIPVVVKVLSTRRKLVYLLFTITAATYFLDGAVQIVASLASHVFLPSLPLYRNIVPYALGGLAAFAFCAVGMALDEQAAKALTAWGTVYPRLLNSLGIVGEIAILGVYSAALQDSKPEAPAVAYTHLAIQVVRVVALVILILSQTPVLAKRSFVPYAKVALGQSERTGLLANAAIANGYGATSSVDTDPAKRKPLRSSRPPSNRPDPKSLQLSTMFTRVRTLFPYLWPSKSLSLQVLACVCIALMFVRRAVNVIVPVALGRVVNDLAAGKPPFFNIGIYVAANFVRDTNSMLIRYLWLPIEQYSEREMAFMSFDCLLNLSMSYHTKRKTGELIRILDRADAINDFASVS